MPGLVRAGRKRPSLTVLDDVSDSDSASSAPANKRPRYADDASESTIATDNRDSGANGAFTDEDVFQPGSIIRVKLKNFVTYTAAEFHLGPSLNMVIGPNGTGKSTLVCAICLGLGWSSEHLGRSKELGAFVKHGAAEAEIEIELAKSERMARNPVIRRSIRKEDNKTVFWLNNKHTPKNAILELARSLNIQIDNLCQFLPQDRVVEFAKMTDQNRLVETQRAAAPPYMIEWHDQLKDLRKQEKALEIEQETQQTDLAKLERLQNSTRGDVERFNQRQGLVTKAKALERVRPIIEIQLRKQEVSQVKTDLRTARIELDTLNGEVEPVRQAQAEVETYRTQIDQAVKLRKNRVDMAKTQAEKLVSRVDKEKQAVVGLAAEARAEGEAKKTRERDIVRINGQIALLERQRQERPVDYNPDDYQERQNELRVQLNAANRRMTEVDATMGELKARSGPIIQRRTNIRAQLEQLSTQSGKQANLLARVSRDTATAWKWFQENKHDLDLRGEVYGPPILTCSIPDTKYVQAIESQMRKGDVIGITCTNGEDQKLLMQRFTGKVEDKNLGLHDIFLRTSPKPLSSYQDPVAREELEQYGFEGYLVDYMQGPDAVIAMLCDNIRLNRIAFASTPISNQQHEATIKSAIQTFVSGRETYKITTRREYGASSTSVSSLRKAQYFTDQPANTEEKRVLDDKMKQNQQESQELQDQLNEMKSEKNQLQEQINDARQQRDAIKEEEVRMRRALAEWEALPRKIQTKQDEKNRIVQEQAETSDRIRVIKAKSRDTSLKIADLTLEYAKLVTQLRVLHESYVEAQIRLIEATSEGKALVKENETILRQQQMKQTEIQRLDEHFNTLRRETKRLVESTQQTLNSLTTEEREVVSSYKHLATVEELELEIQSVNARLGMMAEGNAGVIKAYEKREDEIQAAQAALQDFAMNLTEKKERITEIRSRWEPELDALIAKISDAFAYNFQQIGCVGEVNIHKDEDFDNWSAQIVVRFREGESLQVLDSHRQSGGERSVSTFFYLMAMQDLAQSPFRVVDEINQGMDPRNERKVHERVVDVACQEHTSQYFLVTPKLLSGLKYHPKMKVHIINSGEHIPASTSSRDEWNLKDMAKVALAVRDRVAA